MNDNNYQALIQKLLDCAITCENCATECLKEKDVQMMARCISLDRDCTDICVLVARLLTRNSEVGHQFLVLCEQICRICCAECGKHQHEHCQECAKICNDCAEACHAHHQPVTQY